MKNYILTIAIPTYNRSTKLQRLLNLLKFEIIRLGLSEIVTILVSDNSENDLTENLVIRFNKDIVSLQYYKQQENIGFDANLLFLYQKCFSKYIWFMSDDDIPLADSLTKILSAINSKQPEVLLFSFIQPPGSTFRTFDFKEDVHIIDDPTSIIKNILKYPKISIYLLKKVDFTETQSQNIKKYIGQGWLFLVLSFSVVELSNNPCIAIISEHLATADDDFNHIWVPTPFLYMHNIGFHPYILKNEPNLHKELKIDGYIQCIIFSWALKRGVLTLDDSEGLNNFIDKLEWRLSVLLLHPKILLQFFLMKYNLIPKFFIKKE